MKQKVIIVFSSLRQLWEFLKATNISSVEINTNSNTLYCECERRSILIAEDTFKATVIEPRFQSTGDHG